MKGANRVVEPGGYSWSCTPFFAQPSELLHFFLQAEDGIRDLTVTGVQTCALPIYPPPVERRRRRSWLTTGASHELVELPAEGTTESRSPTQKPGVRHEEATRQVEDPQRVTRWLTESQQMVDRVIPALIEERDRLRQSLEARERECEQLRAELDETRRNLGALQSELERLRGERAATVKAVDDVVAVLAQLHRPMYAIGRRL